MNNLSLIKQVHDKRKLNAYESHHIRSDENAINGDNGNVVLNLFYISIFLSFKFTFFSFLLSFVRSVYINAHVSVCQRVFVLCV